MAGTNWAKNLTYRAKRLHRPVSVDEVRRIVAGSERVKVLGSRHCFNDIADTTEDHLSLDALPAEVEIDGDVVWVPGGMRYGELATHLAASGLALHNMASLPHITVVGATATGTHGSGVGNRSLSAAVAGLDLVRADGELVRLRPDDPDFPGAVVHLGALGVVTRIGLRVQPAFDVATTVHLGLGWDALLGEFDAVMSAAYSVSVFTDFDEVIQVWAKARVGDEARGELFGARPAEVPTHMLGGTGIENLTDQLGAAGPWHDRLPHFKAGFTPSNGDELQSEYFVPAEHGAAALAALRPLADKMAPLLQISEVRTIAADDLWLSPAHGADSVAFHFTWWPQQSAVEALLPDIEAALEPFGGRPHWGKLFATEPADLDLLYPKLADFRSLARRFDPDGRFTNDFLARTIGL
ncbi:D-arabinono-1,4-lactone oxidase [Saccharopolyspora sp. TS4A08]|uniref:D-arabinono-1,4-lactone oxidase n=1 Tax=Saccharopolyspora ipomoeae TaxID=3042027 RepID=A0ABT6PJ76_9PSEU|nr:D-arabinono-1,4-lactone oxidase [Saccharopolyspora sp. TS4A08]MDI2028054.1 D-arabinono-1,4-lactone oxidase [Saccharopolyspora sp. TS4A08]